MEKPLVSIAMLTYNHGPFIRKAIECILSQKTTFPYELVIGEDFSSDGTRETVFDLGKKNDKIITVITSDKNVGMHENHIRTLKSCQGKYIAFCEGDDYWHRYDKLQKQVSFLEKNSEYGLVFTDCDVYYNETKKLIKGFNYLKGYHSAADLDIEEVIWGPVVRWTCTAIARKQLLDKIVDDDPYLHKEGNFMLCDLQLWVELSLLSKVAYFPESLATYRVSEESASRTKNQIKLFSYYKSVSELRLYLYEKYKLSKRIKEVEEKSWFDNTLRLSLFQRNPALAIKVKKRKTIFTLKEWIYYLGAKYAIFYYGYRGASFFWNLIKNKRQEVALSLSEICQIRITLLKLMRHKIFMGLHSINTFEMFLMQENNISTVVQSYPNYFNRLLHSNKNRVVNIAKCKYEFKIQRYKCISVYAVQHIEKRKESFRNIYRFTILGF